MLCSLRDLSAHHQPHNIAVAEVSFELSVLQRTWQPKGTGWRDMFVRLPFGPLRV